MLGELEKLLKAGFYCRSMNNMNFTTDHMKKKAPNKQYVPNLCFYKEKQVITHFCQDIAHERR